MRPTDRTGIAVIVSVALACLTVRPLTEDGSFLALSWLLIGLIGGIGLALRRSRFGGATVLAAQSVGLVLFSLGAQRPDADRRPAVVRELCRPVGARHRAHAHPGLADGTQRRRTADLHHGGRNHHDHDRPAGQRSQPARAGRWRRRRRCSWFPRSDWASIPESPTSSTSRSATWRSWSPKGSTRRPAGRAGCPATRPTDSAQPRRWSGEPPAISRRRRWSERSCSAP